MDFLFEDPARRQNRQVFGYVDSALSQFEELDLLPLLAGAEDDSQGRPIPRFLIMLGQPPKVELHLALVFRFELADFEVDGHQPPQLAVIEQKVDVEVVVVELEALLAGDEGEAGSELQEEGLELPEDGASTSFSRNRSVNPKKSRT